MIYIQYIKSEEWRNKSKKFILEQGSCEKCGSGFKLTCHHKHYKTLGFERRKDILVLCWYCHKKFHEVGGKRIFTRELDKKLSNSKKKYKQLIKSTIIENSMVTQYLRKGKIRGHSKTKSRKLYEQIKNS